MAKKQCNTSALFTRVLITIIFLSTLLYSYINIHNETIELRMEIPVLNKEVKELKARTTKMKYEIEKFESPAHLIELSGKPEFGHLKHPYIDDIILLEEGGYTK